MSFIGVECGLVFVENCSNCFLQDSAEVHANAAETLCMITRFAPPGLAAKITSPK